MIALCCFQDLFQYSCNGGAGVRELRRSIIHPLSTSLPVQDGLYSTGNFHADNSNLLEHWIITVYNLDALSINDSLQHLNISKHNILF